MLRNKNVWLSLVTILALASFGFTSFGAVSAGSAGAYSVAIQSLPAATSNVITATSARCGDSDSDNDDAHNCGEDGSNEPDADDNLAAVKVTPELAGICALHKQPAGTQVWTVDGVYAELSYPYYKVTLTGPQGQPVVYINATNCNIIPAP
jgi:hypothetical protein